MPVVVVRRLGMGRDGRVRCWKFKFQELRQREGEQTIEDWWGFGFSCRHYLRFWSVLSVCHTPPDPSTQTNQSIQR